MRKLLKTVLMVAILALAIAPVAAQDDEAVGGVVIDSTFGSGPVNFNPVTSTGATEQDIMNLLYPNLLGVNPETGVIEPGAPGSVSTSWEVSEDGLTYTFTLAEGWTWSDGDPITARDWEFVWDSVLSGEVETNLIFLTDSIDTITAIDDYTLEVKFFSPGCESLNNAGLQPVPSHLYDGLDDPFIQFNEDRYTEPEALEVGPYQLRSQVSDQQTGLVPAENDGYLEDAVVNDGYVLRIVGSQTVQTEQFLAGETDVLRFIPPDRRGDVVAAAEAGNVGVYEYVPGDAYDYFAFNLASPDNPQAALDEDGNLIEQDPHPLFSDVRVRQAISMAVNIESIIEGAVFGYGSPMHSSYAQGTWPYNPDVPYYEFDQQAALDLLAEAGWVDHDNDVSTPLVCEDCLNAEAGAEFRFELLTNQGNTRREAIATIVQDQLSQIGIAVDFQTIDFNVLLDVIDNQTFDAFILGWRNAYPFRADQQQLWSTTSDVIAGDNFTSYINPELDALFEKAATVPGCDLEERAAIYGEVQEILHRDVPYMFLFSIDGMYTWQSEIEGINPFPAALYWNINEWTVTEQ
jgi:peptide/nickel transport system substrate-binding protein